MVYWSITGFFPVSSCFQHSAGKPQVQDGVLVPSGGRESKVEERESYRKQPGNQENSPILCVTQTLSISKDNSVLPGM